MDYNLAPIISAAALLFMVLGGFACLWRAMNHWYREPNEAEQRLAELEVRVSSEVRRLNESIEMLRQGIASVHEKIETQYDVKSAVDDQLREIEEDIAREFKDVKLRLLTIEGSR